MAAGPSTSDILNFANITPARQPACRRHELDDVAVLEGKVRYGDEGAVTHDENMPARQLEETLDIGDVFAAAIALPRQTAAEAELTAATDGNDGADVGDLHDDLPPRF